MPELTQAQLKKLLHYCPDTGIFTWLPRDRSMFKSASTFKSFSSRYSGKQAGSTHRTNGYVVICITDDSGKEIHHKAHRLAWLYVKGVWPNVIDHGNRVKTDNRFDNLTNTTPLGNSRNKPILSNNTSGVTGVYAVGKKWIARIKSPGSAKNASIGTFDNIFDAACARKSAEAKLGFHPNHGRK